MIYGVIKDCFCEGYLNEITRHWREGIEKMELKKGDEVEFVEEWSNFFGRYIRVRKNGKTYDIKPKYLVKLK